MGRREKEFHIIYKTTCVVNNKFYVGMHSTDNLNDGYIGSGKRLWYSVNKHGRNNFTFEILEYLPNREELKKREKEIINEEFLLDELCLNLMLGGEGGRGFTSEEQKLNNLKSQKKQINLRKDLEWVSKKSKKISEANKKCYENGRERKFSYDWTGKTHKEESKKKMSESMKGKGLGSTNSQYGSCWITNETENKKIMKGALIPDGWRLGRKLKFVNIV